MIRVYIASPYTLGDSALNVRRQIDKFEELSRLGFAPFAPLYAHFQHMFYPKTDTEWLVWDFQWLRASDCVLRLPGKSSGADEEEKEAKKNNIPLFYTVEELCAHYGVEFIKDERFYEIEERVTSSIHFTE